MGQELTLEKGTDTAMKLRLEPRSESPHSNNYLALCYKPKLRFIVAWSKYQALLKRSEEYHAGLRSTKRYRSRPTLRITLSFKQFLENYGYDLRGGIV